MQINRKVVISFVISVVVFTSAILINLILVRTRKAPEEVSIESRSLRVNTLTVQRQDLTETLTGYGTARSMHTSNLTAQVSGTIILRDKSAREGTRVKAGQVLFTIDPRDYQERVTQLTQQVDSQEAQIEQLNIDEENCRIMLNISESEHRIATDEYKRISDLFEEKRSSKREVDLIDSARQKTRASMQQCKYNLSALGPKRKILKSQLKLLQSQLETARLNMRRCKIKSPFTGQIVKIYCETGQTVPAGYVTAVITDPSQIEVPVVLPASARFRVKIGAKAELKPEVKQPGRWEGKIERLNAQIDPASRTVEVYVVVRNPLIDPPLAPGAFVEVKIQGREYKSVIAIPRSSIRNDHVFIMKDNLAVERKIKILRTLEEQTLISDGLSEGEKLIISNLDALYDGAKIKIQQTTD